MNVIDPGSPLYLQLQKAVLSGKRIRLTDHPRGVQVKIGEGTWTVPLSGAAPEREEDDARKFKRGECDHLICLQCGGHKDFRETYSHEGEPDDSDNWRSCMCCKHCNDPRGH